MTLGQLSTSVQPRQTYIESGQTIDQLTHWRTDTTNLKRTKATQRLKFHRILILDSIQHFLHLHLDLTAFSSGITSSYYIGTR